ncbi:Lysophospholipase L1 [Jatrophihabitans endophyticus]|uniref:Lysophospholipase L1 n=1 Tax=Jatrophihabitans endophyticus TaxID=1206085 RepID=A0A1M5RDK9_9ACTN|nr:SGNH/GDSL hydrolase family protein [Jatrophihabitans endophyticus]SHH24384.1 Lysophospholipase L1 [Jatrophihabitans endophyticus]
MTDVADRVDESNDPYCLSDAAVRHELAGAPWRRFGVIGDSLAEGLGEDVPGYRSLPWAERVRDAIAQVAPAPPAYCNLGRRQLTAAEIRDGQLREITQFGPDLAAVTAGGNDLFGRGFDPDGVERAVEQMVATLRANGADVITYGLMDIGAAWPRLAMLRPRMVTLNTRMRAVAERHDAVHVDMWEHPICGDRSAYSTDMLHTSMRGHAVLAAETVKALGARLRRG